MRLAQRWRCSALPCKATEVHRKAAKRAAKELTSKGEPRRAQQRNGKDKNGQATQRDSFDLHRTGIATERNGSARPSLVRCAKVKRSLELRCYGKELQRYEEHKKETCK